MARKPDDRKPTGRKPKRGGGFKRAATTARKAIDQVAGKHGFAEADVLLNWPDIAGQALARVCQPVRVHYGKERALGAVLIVQTNSARAPEVEHKGPLIVEKVNRYYGYRAVRRLKVTQSTGLGFRTRSAPGFAEAQAPFDARPQPPAAPEPTAEEAAEAAAMTAGIQSPGLRAALTLMGANVLAQDRRDAANDD